MDNMERIDEMRSRVRQALGEDVSGRIYGAPYDTPPPHDYDALEAALNAALHQATDGKGAARHSTGQDFRDQPIMTITRTHGVGFPMGQAAKKIQEAARMNAPAARQELLGAIVYLAAAWVAMGDDT